MNETVITSLVRQAANEMDKVPANNPAYEELAKLLVKQDNQVLKAFHRKLIEVTVRECASVVRKKTGPKTTLDVLEHFGVEE